MNEKKIGKGTKIYDHRKTNLYGCSIGRNCKVACFVEIGRNVVIGDNCKISMGAFIPEGVIIEDNVFIAPNVVFTNDKYPRSTGEWEIRKTVVKEGASIGANSTIICGVVLGENSMVGAGSVVTKDVKKNELVFGNPAKVVENG